MSDDARLQTVRLQLLHGQKWRYLRYVHLRAAVASIADQIETVCVAGAGLGIAELAIALEFPHLSWTLTDISPAEFTNTMRHCWRWEIPIQFSIWNVLKPSPRRFDLVCSTEMLEHIKDDRRAVDNMRESARKYVYCLVPFASAKEALQVRRAARLLEQFGHHVPGYDADRLRELFGDGAVAGTYWADAGGALREALTGMTPDAIASSIDDLVLTAEKDLKGGLPSSYKEASGIKILAPA